MNNRKKPAKKDDTPRITGPVLSEPAGEAPVELEQRTRRLIPANLRFTRNGSPIASRVAVQPLPGPKEAESGPAGGERTIAITGPKTQRAVALGMIEADFPGGIAVPKETKRGRVMEWVQMRSMEPGITNIECAKRMGIAVSYLNGCISQARKEGWLRFEDPMARMEFEIVPKTIDNLSALLDAKDKTATIETAKGTIFKSYLSSQGISEQPQTVLALRIDRADGTNMNIVTGRIVGRAKHGPEQEAE